MRQRLPAALAGLATALLTALPLAAQEPRGPIGGPFRPYLFVLLAFGIAWLLIGAWVYRIAGKLRRLSRRLDRDREGPGEPPRP